MGGSTGLMMGCPWETETMTVPGGGGGLCRHQPQLCRCDLVLFPCVAHQIFWKKFGIFGYVGSIKARQHSAIWWFAEVIAAMIWRLPRKNAYDASLISVSILHVQSKPKHGNVMCSF